MAVRDAASGAGRRGELLLVLALTLLAVLPSLPSTGDWVADEVLFMNGGLIMKEGGSLLVPARITGEPRFAKPVLHYWIVLLSYTLFGVSLAAARLPALASALVTLAFTYLLASEDGDREAGAAAVWILAGSNLFCYYGRTCLTDMTMTAGIVGGMYFLARHMKDASRGRDLYLSALWLGLAGMAKGYVAIALAGLAVVSLIAWARIKGRGIFAARPLARYIPPLLIMIAVAGWWYAYMLWRFGGEFMSLHAGQEVTARADLSAASRVGNVLYYLEKVFFTALPWSITFVILLFTRRRPLPSRPARTLAWSFVSGFAVLYILAVNISHSAKYLVPLMPFLAIIAGDWIVGALRSDTLRAAAVRSLRVLGGAVLTVSAAAAGAFLVLARNDLSPLLAFECSVVLGGAALLLAALLRHPLNGPDRIVPLVGMAMLLLFFANVSVFQDALNRSPVAALARDTFYLEEGQSVDIEELDYMESGLLYFFGDRSRLAAGASPPAATHRLVRSGRFDQETQVIAATAMVGEAFQARDAARALRRGDLLSSRPRKDAYYLVKVGR